MTVSPGCTYLRLSFVFSEKNTMFFLKDSHKIGVLGEIRKKTVTEPSESTEEQCEDILMKV